MALYIAETIFSLEPARNTMSRNIHVTPEYLTIMDVFKFLPTIPECCLELSIQLTGQGSSWPLPFLLLLSSLPLSRVSCHGNLPHGLHLSNVVGSKVELTERFREGVGQTLRPTALKERLQKKRNTKHFSWISQRNKGLLNFGPLKCGTWALARDNADHTTIHLPVGALILR